MNSKKGNIIIIQNKFYESLKQKEIMYKELEEKNKKDLNENDENIEFNYPYYIYQEIKKKEKEDKKFLSEENGNESSHSKYNKKERRNDKTHKNIQLLKSNIEYNILYEY